MDALKGILGVMEIAQDMQEKAKKGEKENRRYLKNVVLNMKYICTINLLPEWGDGMSNYQIVTKGDGQLCMLFNNIDVKVPEPFLSTFQFKKNVPYKGIQLQFLEEKEKEKC